MALTADQFWYENEDGIETPLNFDLAHRQGCTETVMYNIMLAHGRRVSVWKHMAILKDTNVEQLKALAYTTECIEFELQGYWGFEQDRDFHTFWFKVPGCKCPKMDNADSMFHGRRVVVQGCPIHWMEEDDG